MEGGDEGIDMRLTRLFVKKETVPFGEYTYTLYRSSRRTIGIQVRGNGEIVVRAPFFCSREEVHGVVVSKLPWICERRAIIERTAAEADSPEGHYFDGALLPFGSGVIRLRLSEDPAAERYTVTLHDVNGAPELALRGRTLDPQTCKLLVSRWGRRYAAEVYRDLVAQWASRIGVDYAGISVKDTKSRWGSCSAAGNINLHWKLILLPERLRDYVIVHELCHRREMNHSKAFWELVGSFLPDFSERRGELRSVEKEILRW